IADEVDQADGVHVKDGGCVGIVAKLGRITGDADKVVQAECAGAKQIALDTEDVAVTAGVVEYGLNAAIALDDGAERLIAHAGRGARTVRYVDRVDADAAQKLRRCQLLSRV